MLSSYWGKVRSTEILQVRGVSEGVSSVLGEFKFFFKFFIVSSNAHFLSFRISYKELIDP
jgi:hypothetical protein